MDLFRYLFDDEFRHSGETRVFCTTSASGTDLPVRLGLAMYNKMCQVKSDLIHFTIVLTLTISRHEKITARTAKEHLQVPGNTYLFQGFNDPYFFD